MSALIAVEAQELSVDDPMAVLGLDSLVAIELKNWLTRTLQAPVQTTDIMDAASLKSFAAFILQKSALVAKEMTVPKTSYPNLSGLLPDFLSSIVGTQGSLLLPHCSTRNTTTGNGLPVLQRFMLQPRWLMLRRKRRKKEANAARLLAEYSYYGPTGNDNLAWALKRVSDKPRTWEEFVRNNEPWFL
ncbi:hypothetical protein F5B21DRAFT_507664 [Xylaria acuta]|nr:hypothetical protein F5B21DRAFT_507664 [Xylaria acuta]